MNIEIITNVFRADIYGFSATVLNKDYVGTLFQLSGKMWEKVKQQGLKNKGKNIWVYEVNNNVFAGIELEQRVNEGAGLDLKNIDIKKYAYYKHIGPYSLIKQAGQTMTTWLKENGQEITDPYIEIYGHWTNDDTKLETELIMGLK